MHVNRHLARSVCLPVLCRLWGTSQVVPMSTHAMLSRTQRSGLGLAGPWVRHDLGTSWPWVRVVMGTS